MISFARPPHSRARASHLDIDLESARADLAGGGLGFMRHPSAIGRQTLLTAAAASLTALPTAPAVAALAEKLAARDASLLTKPPGMLAPPEAAYPQWLAGEWQASLNFAGYELPAKDAIPRADLFAEGNVPGFQKCSIAFIPDVGKENVTFPMKWVRDASGLVREDRDANLRAAVRGGLGYDAVERVEYKEDPMMPKCAAQRRKREQCRRARASPCASSCASPCAHPAR